MARLRLTHAARNDLRAIHRQSEELFCLDQADLYSAGIAKALNLIADYPQANRLRSDTARPVRVLPYKSLIIYAVEKNDVVILRVRHAQGTVSTTRNSHR